MCLTTPFCPAIIHVNYYSQFPFGFLALPFPDESLWVQRHSFFYKLGAFLSVNG